MARLERRSVGNHNPDPYCPPEYQQPALHGKVFGHHRKADGTEVTTSPITGIETGCVKTESGTLYELGEVDPAYEETYPNAREKLFKAYSKP